MRRPHCSAAPPTPNRRQAAKGPQGLFLVLFEGRYGAERRRDCLVFAGPFEPGAGQQPDLATVEPGVHAIAVEFELVGPFVAARGFLANWQSCGLIHAGSMASEVARAGEVLVMAD